MSRYRAAPLRAVFTPEAMGYVAVNIAASVGALALTRAFGWAFGVTGPEAIFWTQILVAGFGAMVLFRSSLFSVPLDSTTRVYIGPSTLLQALLDVSDRAVDRREASVRAKNVARRMEGLEFSEEIVALPTLCLALMQHLPAEEQKALAQEYLQLEQTNTIDNRTKALMLGLSIMNFMGESVLAAGIDALRYEQTAGQPVTESPQHGPVATPRRPAAA